MKKSGLQAWGDIHVNVAQHLKVPNNAAYAFSDILYTHISHKFLT